MNRLLSSLLVTFFAFGIISCEKQKEPYTEFLGTWKINEVSINDVDQVLSQCELNATISFEEYNLCKHYDACLDTITNDSWSLTSNIININTLLPLSFEVENVSSSNLNLVTYDFDSIGAVRISQYNYVKISE